MFIFNYNFITLHSKQIQVGSYAYDETKMIYNTSLLQYDDSLRNTILDYNVNLDPLKAVDSLFVWQSIGNYSLTGFEMTLRRNSLKYLVNYYLPSGLFVIVSWVSADIEIGYFLGKNDDIVIKNF